MNRPAAALIGPVTVAFILMLAPMQRASATPFRIAPQQVKLTPDVVPAFDIFQRPERQEAQMATTPGSTLEGEPWAIDRATGIAEITPPHPRLTFSNGQLRFDAPCNFYLTGFTLSGKDLAFEPFGNMPKVCEPDVMNLETALLDRLARVTAYTIDAEGMLILNSLGNEVLRARR